MGKVRNGYNLPEVPGYPDLRLSETTDGISADDFILPAMIPYKGEVLNCLSHYWEEKFRGLFLSDHVAMGSRIDGFIPSDLRGDVGVQKRCAVIQGLDMLDGEFIVRGFLAGSGLKSYQKNRTICGQLLPEGLENGDQLPYPLFTPTTKAKEGHDQHMPIDEAISRFGFGAERLALQIYGAAAFEARKRGIIIADTKFEFGKDRQGRLRWADEKLTPDSSRFWSLAEWTASRGTGKAPSSHDKDPVRAWLRAVAAEHGYKELDPKNPEHVKFVHSLEMPASVILATSRRYRFALFALTGLMLEKYQRDRMGIKVEVPQRKILVMVGSESDLPQLNEGMEYLRKNAHGKLIVLSCHRNSKELLDLSGDVSFGYDVVIDAAGEAAQLPGVHKAKLQMYGREDVAVIGVGLKGKDREADDAARLSIKRLPGQPVELDQNGEPYFGPEGFVSACRAAVDQEFMVKKYSYKPSRLVEEF